MPRIAKGIAFAGLSVLAGCSTIQTPWDRLRDARRPPEAAAQDEEAPARPINPRSSDRILIPQQARGGYNDSPAGF